MPSLEIVTRYILKKEKNLRGKGANPNPLGIFR